MPEQYKYDLYFSLGGACACTQILRYCQLQYTSYPFDWLMGATVTDRHLNKNNKGKRKSFIKSQPTPEEQIQRHKPGIKIARHIMEHNMYCRLS